MSQLWDRLRHWRNPAYDPMITLELQAQLGRLVAEVRRADTHHGFAGAHHAMAATWAYENTLRRALRHAGGTDCDFEAGDIVGLELDLSARGWTW